MLLLRLSVVSMILCGEIVEFLVKGVLWLSLLIVTLGGLMRRESWIKFSLRSASYL